MVVVVVVLLVLDVVVVLVLEELVVTDSINTRDISKLKKVREVSVGTLFGEAIRRVTNEESVSSLFN